MAAIARLRQRSEPIGAQERFQNEKNHTFLVTKMKEKIRSSEKAEKSQTVCTYKSSHVENETNDAAIKNDMETVRKCIDDEEMVQHRAMQLTDCRCIMQNENEKMRNLKLPLSLSLVPRSKMDSNLLADCESYEKSHKRTKKEDIEAENEARKKRMCAAAAKKKAAAEFEIHKEIRHAEMMGYIATVWRSTDAVLKATSPSASKCATKTLKQKNTVHNDFVSDVSKNAQESVRKLYADSHDCVLPGYSADRPSQTYIKFLPGLTNFAESEYLEDNSSVAEKGSLENIERIVVEEETESERQDINDKSANIIMHEKLARTKSADANAIKNAADWNGSESGYGTENSANLDELENVFVAEDTPVHNNEGEGCCIMDTSTTMGEALLKFSVEIEDASIPITDTSISLGGSGRYQHTVVDIQNIKCRETRNTNALIECGVEIALAHDAVIWHKQKNKPDQGFKKIESTCQSSDSSVFVSEFSYNPEKAGCCSVLCPSSVGIYDRCVAKVNLRQRTEEQDLGWINVSRFSVQKIDRRQECQRQAILHHLIDWKLDVSLGTEENVQYFSIPYRKCSSSSSGSNHRGGSYANEGRQSTGSSCQTNGTHSSIELAACQQRQMGSGSENSFGAGGGRGDGGGDGGGDEGNNFRKETFSSRGSSIKKRKADSDKKQKHTRGMEQGIVDGLKENVSSSSEWLSQNNRQNNKQHMDAHTHIDGDIHDDGGGPEIPQHEYLDVHLDAEGNTDNPDHGNLEDEDTAYLIAKVLEESTDKDNNPCQSLLISDLRLASFFKCFDRFFTISSPSDSTCHTCTTVKSFVTHIFRCTNNSGTCLNCSGVNRLIKIYCLLQNAKCNSPSNYRGGVEINTGLMAAEDELIKKIKARFSTVNENSDMDEFQNSDLISNPSFSDSDKENDNVCSSIEGTIGSSISAAIAGGLNDSVTDLLPGTSSTDLTTDDTFKHNSPTQLIITDNSDSESDSSIMMPDIDVAQPIFTVAADLPLNSPFLDSPNFFLADPRFKSVVLSSGGLSSGLAVSTPYSLTRPATSPLGHSGQPIGQFMPRCYSLVPPSIDKSMERQISSLSISPSDGHQTFVMPLADCVAYYSEIPATNCNFVSSYQAAAIPLYSVPNQLDPSRGHVRYGSKNELKRFASEIECGAPSRDGLPQPAHRGIIRTDYAHLVNYVVPQIRIKYGSYRLNNEWASTTDKPIGRGMFGRCIAGVDSDSDHIFCAKEMDVSKFCASEVDIWSGLQHPGINELYGLIVDGETVFILQELIQGGTLKERIDTSTFRCLDSYMALTYLQNLLHILVYLKCKTVIHNDIKADNIMLRHCDGHSIILIDYGLSQLTAHVDKDVGPVGAQTNWSPEKASSQGYDDHADVWAAVCVFVHMLKGIEPWLSTWSSGDRPKLLHYAIGTLTEPPMVSNVPDNLPSCIRNLIEVGWTIDPNSRPTAEQLLLHDAFSLLDTHPPNDTIFYNHMPHSSIIYIDPAPVELHTSIFDDGASGDLLSQVECYEEGEELISQGLGVVEMLRKHSLAAQNLQSSSLHPSQSETLSVAAQGQQITTPLSFEHGSNLSGELRFSMDSGSHLRSGMERVFGGHDFARAHMFNPSEEMQIHAFSAYPMLSGLEPVHEERVFRVSRYNLAQLQQMPLQQMCNKVTDGTHPTGELYSDARDPTESSSSKNPLFLSDAYRGTAPTRKRHAIDSETSLLSSGLPGIKLSTGYNFMGETDLSNDDPIFMSGLRLSTGFNFQESVASDVLSQSKTALNQREGSIAANCNMSYMSTTDEEEEEVSQKFDDLSIKGFPIHVTTGCANTLAGGHQPLAGSDLLDAGTSEHLPVNSRRDLAGACVSDHSSELGAVSADLARSDNVCYMELCRDGGFALRIKDPSSLSSHSVVSEQQLGLVQQGPPINHQTAHHPRHQPPATSSADAVSGSNLIPVFVDDYLSLAPTSTSLFSVDDSVNNNSDHSQVFDTIIRRSEFTSTITRQGTRGAASGDNYNDICLKRRHNNNNDDNYNGESVTERGDGYNTLRKGNCSSGRSDVDCDDANDISNPILPIFLDKFTLSDEELEEDEEVVELMEEEGLKEEQMEERESGVEERHTRHDVSSARSSGNIEGAQKNYSWKKNADGSKERRSERESEKEIDTMAAVGGKRGGVNEEGGGARGGAENEEGGKGSRVDSLDLQLISTDSDLQQTTETIQRQMSTGLSSSSFSPPMSVGTTVRFIYNGQEFCRPVHLHRFTTDYTWSSIVMRANEHRPAGVEIFTAVVNTGPDNCDEPLDIDSYVPALPEIRVTIQVLTDNDTRTGRCDWFIRNGTIEHRPNGGSFRPHFYY